MVVKFFKSKKGGGVASVDYLLNEREKQGTARILQGDKELTKNLILSMAQKHKTCVGCLSFEETNIDENTKKEIMQSFENALLTPEMQGKYNILWVEHTDKNRLELNFVIPKINLESKKAFNPHFHMADSKRIEIWQDFVNLEHNFTNPKDPAKQNTIQGSKKEIGLIQDYEALDSFLHSQVKEGLINSRDDILSLLKQSNIEITRQGKDYIGIKLPNSTKAKRFKGGIYDEQFTSISELSKISGEHKERERAFNARDNTKELERLKQELDSHIQSKARFYVERNTPKARIDKQRNKAISLSEHQPSSIESENIVNNILMRNANNDDFKRDCVVSVDKALSSIKGTYFRDREREIILHNTAESNAQSRQEQSSNTNSIAQGNLNDSPRDRINSRSREIANRARICFNTARNITEQEQRIDTKTRELDNRISKFREFLQQQFREISDRIRQIINKRKERQRQRYRGMSR